MPLVLSRVQLSPPVACMSRGPMSRDPFGGTPKNLTEAQSLIVAVQRSAEDVGVTVRLPPPIPTTCCGRGCSGCVWEGYYAALIYWRDQAVEKLGVGRASGDLHFPLLGDTR